MGKVTSEPQKETTTKTHFSHPHPLKLTPHHQQQQTLNLASSSCPACNLKPSGTIYSCAPCDFFIHTKCSEIPRKIMHPFHKDHVLNLIPKPAYAEGLFNCDACGETGNGFSYHCKPCGIDLHALCALMPSSVVCTRHAHKLKLTFESPYGSKSFCCAICKSTAGSSHWLYRCEFCGFDAHLNCAGGGAPPVGASLQQQNNINFMGFGPLGPMAHNAGVDVPAGGQMIMPDFAGIRQSNEWMIQAINQQMINYNNAMAQVILAGGAGGFGGGFGGDRRSQQLMQLISGLNNGGIGGGGLNGFGGAAGGQDLMQALMSRGGDGGFDLQSLLAGGGGDGAGGQEFLQALTSGGGGLDLQSLLGGGGLDFLGGALGGFGL